MSAQDEPEAASVLAIHPKPDDLPENRRAAWFNQLYGAAEGLVKRYPDDLAGRLRTGWWSRPAERELVSALCALRDRLDNDHTQDRGTASERALAEISFNRDLPLLAERLATASREANAWRVFPDHSGFELWISANAVRRTE